MDVRRCAIAVTGMAVLLLCSCGLADFDSPGLSAAGDLTGRWVGSGRFRLNCPNPAWQWNGRLSPPSVILDLVQSGSVVTGRVTFNIPESDTQLLLQGGDLGPVGLQAQVDILEGSVSSSSLTFTAANGDVWELSFTSDTLAGAVTGPFSPACDAGLVSVNMDGSVRAGNRGWPSISLGRQ